MTTCTCGASRVKRIGHKRECPAAPWQNRETPTGRYAYSNMDRMCVCGHTLGEHSAGWPFDCLTGTGAPRVTDTPPCPEGQCKAFRPAKKKAEVITDQILKEGPDRYEFVSTVGGESYILKITSESAKLLVGVEVNDEGDEIVPRGKNAQGQRYTDRTRIIDKSLIKSRKPMQWNLTYGTLEVM